MVGQYLGILGDVVNSITNGLKSIADWIMDGINSIMDGIMNGLMAWLLKIIYTILQGAYFLIDLIVLIFRKMCGLDTVQIGSGYIGSLETGGSGEFSGDLALALIQSKQVADVFVSLLIVAVILLFVFTFIAIIKNQYNPDKSKGSNGPIIGLAFKALFTFLFVPAICIFGIFVSNGLLKTIDNATRLSASTTISGQIFAASASSANRIQTDQAFWEYFKQDTSGINPNGMFTNSISYGDITDERQRAVIALNDAFAGKIKLTQATDINMYYHDGKLKHMQNVESIHNIERFDYMNTDLVWAYYDLGKFNWLMAFISVFFVGAALLVSSIGIIQRLYEITILFAVSPPFVALMPLDGGKAFGGWSKKFIEDVLIMYGTVVAVNFFFILTPILQHINLFYTAEEIATYSAVGCRLFNDIAHVLFIICGALLIKDFSALVTGLVTGNDKAGDLMQRGGNMRKAITETATNAYNMASTAKSAGASVKKSIMGEKDDHGNRKGGLRGKILGDVKTDDDGNIIKDSNGKVVREGGLKNGYHNAKAKAVNFASGVKSGAVGLGSKVKGAASGVGSYAANSRVGQFIGRKAKKTAIRLKSSRLGMAASDVNAHLGNVKRAMIAGGGSIKSKASSKVSPALTAAKTGLKNVGGQVKTSIKQFGTGINSKWKLWRNDVKARDEKYIRDKKLNVAWRKGSSSIKNKGLGAKAAKWEKNTIQRDIDIKIRKAYARQFSTKKYYAARKAKLSNADMVKEIRHNRKGRKTHP